MPLKAVLFDMDGVLYDSMPNHATAWSEAATRFGLTMTPQEAYLHEGRTGHGTLTILAQRHRHRDATLQEMEQIYKVKSEIFNTCPAPVPMPGAAELLQSISRLGLTIVLVTGSAQHSLLDRLAKDYPGIFAPERMVTAFDVKHGKPHPEPYLMGLEKAGVQASEAIVVENAPLGVEAAHAAGIFTIAVNTGPLDPNVLLDAGADVVLPREGGFSQALDIIKKAQATICKPL